MAKLVVHNLPELRALRKKLRTAGVQLTAFQGTEIRRLAESLVVDTIHQKMRAADFSENIVTNTVLDDIQIRGKKVRLIFKSTFFSPTGFDVALAREKGTKRHMIRPRFAQVLRWIEDGIVKFSKGHEVDGLLSLKIIATTLDEREQPLQDEYNRSLRNFIDNTVGGNNITL